MRKNLMTEALWWMCLFAAPLVLAAIELYHPANFTHHPGMWEYLSRPEPFNPEYKALGYFGPKWWFLLHMIQTPLVGLVAIGLFLMGRAVTLEDGLPARISIAISRAAAFLFVIYYTALDAIGGVGLGRTIELTLQLADQGKLTASQVNGVALVLNATWSDPWVGGVGSVISETGSWAAFAAALFLAAGLFLARRAPWPALIVLVAFGWELQLAHAMPHGPIAFGLLVVSAAWIRLASSRRPGNA